MEDKRIPDSSITASSAYNSNYKAYNGRLNKVYTTTGWGGWFARWNTHQWFEVDFGSKVTISRIATQGHSDYDAWITEYALSHGSGSGPLISYNNNQVSDKTVEPLLTATSLKRPQHYYAQYFFLPGKMTIHFLKRKLR